MSTEAIELYAAEIMDLIPHRYPFLLIDRVIDCTPKESVTVLKNVSTNEPFFEGHFPANPSLVC